MRISVPGDFLIAIAALAKEYHSWNPALGRYLAGHWAEHLEYSLDWIAANPFHEIGTYRAPSWSWASIEGATYLDTSIHASKGEPQIQILECTTMLAEVTLPFGAVTNGHLKIRARLQQVGWRRQNNDYASIYHISNEEVNKDEEEKDKTAPQEIAKAYPDTMENFPLPENDAATNETAFLMNLYALDSYNDRGYSLVLRKCRESTFRRVGITWSFPYIPTSDIVEKEVFYLI